MAGKPFSGRDNIEWTRTLEDGSVVKTRLFAALARDSQGRIYRERRKFVPVDSNQESRQLEIIFLDPVAHTRTNCLVATHRCAIADYHASVSFTPRPAGSIGNGTRYLTRESLGSDVIDGLTVVGTRETTSTSVGVVGNSQPLVATRGFWYSPDLQVNLAVTRRDRGKAPRLSMSRGSLALNPIRQCFRFPQVLSSRDAPARQRVEIDETRSNRLRSEKSKRRGP